MHVELPGCAVIITHHNYSRYVGNALKSLTRQTHKKFRCFIVDDASDADEYDVLKSTVEALKDDRFTIIRSDTNLAQVGAFFRGLEEVTEDFVSILDPDDAYAATFLEDMLTVHLDPRGFVPVVSCGQSLCRVGGDLLTNDPALHDARPVPADYESTLTSLQSRTTYYPPDDTQWRWQATSMLMFRTIVARLLTPHRKMDYAGDVDSYLVRVAHMMGGAFILDKPLVYRGVHTSNRYHANRVISSYQNMFHANAEQTAAVCRLDACEAFFLNQGDQHFYPWLIAHMLTVHLPESQLAELCSRIPRVTDILKDAGANQ